MKSEKIIRQATDRLVADIRARKGLGDELEAIESDIRSEIEGRWYDILSELWQEGYDKGYEDGELAADLEWMDRP